MSWTAPESIADQLSQFDELPTHISIGKIRAKVDPSDWPAFRDAGEEEMKAAWNDYVAGGRPDQLMVDATHLKAHRTAASLLKAIGCSPMYRAHQGRSELQAACRVRRQRPSPDHAAHRRPGERLQGHGPDVRRLAKREGRPWLTARRRSG